MPPTTRTRTPLSLLPYLSPPPPQSLTLLTGTLSCSANWLTARFIGHALDGSSSFREADEEGQELGVGGVVLVSWQRDLRFWKDEVRRVTGVDISRFPCLQRQQSSPSSSTTTPIPAPTASSSSSTTFTFFDLLSSSLLSPSKTPNSLADLEKTILSAASASTTKPTKPLVLILDQPTTHFFLSPSSPSSSAAADLATLILNLRSNPSIHSTILCLSADSPFLSASPSSSRTPLEVDIAAFTLTQAHAARYIMGVRELDTGAARDVSGVLRITRGGEWDERGGGGEKQETGEGEWRYLVGRDGGVKIVD